MNDTKIFMLFLHDGIYDLIEQFLFTVWSNICLSQRKEMCTTINYLKVDLPVISLLFRNFVMKENYRKIQNFP